MCAALRVSSVVRNMGRYLFIMKYDEWGSQISAAGHLHQPYRQCHSELSSVQKQNKEFWKWWYDLNRALISTSYKEAIWDYMKRLKELSSPSSTDVLSLVPQDIWKTYLSFLSKTVEAYQKNFMLLWIRYINPHSTWNRRGLYSLCETLEGYKLVLFSGLMRTDENVNIITYSTIDYHPYIKVFWSVK